MTAITGGPGVGKTALALRWAHRVRRRFTDGDLYIDMRGYNSGNTLGPEQALTSFLRGLGLVALEQHDPGAQEHFEAALTVFREHGIRRGEGMSLLSLAECARSRGDHAEASALCRRAIDIFRSIDDRWSEAWGALPLAESLGELGDFQEAEHHLGRALGTFRDFTDRRSEALTLRRLGDVSAGRRALTAARDLWTQAAAIYEELGDALSDELRRQAEGLPDAIDGDDRG
ncbi:tetratricopeptide repeat protein [Streptomyces kebangsaanensis]|uniref:tetratricopeptide repeat protein n=1 Tax=Streptomyces kebangsaanensis TaxID=864058 RepID=UPI001301839B|nr:tetratricopeptide repeat protein [Streptomyces kebangsaanensis]